MHLFAKMAIRMFCVTNVCVLDLYLLVNLMVRTWFVLFAKDLLICVGVVNLFEIVCFIGMVNSYIRIYYSVYFSYNICLEILINLRIYLVFMRISLCILWNPWISVVNLQYFNLKSIKISQFLTYFYLLSSCTLSDPGCERSVIAKLSV